MGWGDCTTCIHYERDYSYCEECEYYEHEFQDHYEEATPEILKKRERENHQRAVIGAINQYLVVPGITDSFREAFFLAKKCTAYEHFRSKFMAVHISKENTLVASDTCMLFEMPCEDIPFKLLGKNIVLLDGCLSGINVGKYPNYKAIFNSCKNYVSVPLYKFKIESFNDREIVSLPDEYQFLILENFKELFNKKYLDLMNVVLTGNIQVSYNPSTPFLPVLFTGDNGKYIAVPVRKRDYTYKKAKAVGQ